MGYSDGTASPGWTDSDRSPESGAATPIAFVAQAEHPAVDIASPPNAAEHPAVDIAWHHKEPAGISAAGFDVRNLAPETGDRDGAQTMASDIIDTLDRRSLSVGISKGLGSRGRAEQGGARGDKTIGWQVCNLLACVWSCMELIGMCVVGSHRHQCSAILVVARRHKCSRLCRSTQA